MRASTTFLGIFPVFVGEQADVYSSSLMPRSNLSMHGHTDSMVRKASAATFSSVNISTSMPFFSAIGTGFTLKRSSRAAASHLHAVLYFLGVGDISIECRTNGTWRLLLSRITVAETP